MKIGLGLIALTGTIALSACATTTTAEERAYCQHMADEMTLQTTHDHAAMKALPANSMNISHERCQQVLAKK